MGILHSILNSEHSRNQRQWSEFSSPIGSNMGTCVKVFVPVNPRLVKQTSQKVPAKRKAARRHEHLIACVFKSIRFRYSHRVFRFQKSVFRMLHFKTVRFQNSTF